MSARTVAELRTLWISSAANLERAGHFAEYPARRRDEVLKKGYLGNWRPDEALRIAYDQADRGSAFRTPQFNDDMRERGFVGFEVRDAVLAILAEIPPESFRPPRKLANPARLPLPVLLQDSWLPDVLQAADPRFQEQAASSFLVVPSPC